MQKVPKKNSVSLDLDNSIQDEEKPSCTARKLFDAIEECKSPIKSINRVTDLDTQLSKEIDLFRSEVVRSEYLQAAYIVILELIYQRALIARGVFQRHRILATKFVQMTC